MTQEMRQFGSHFASVEDGKTFVEALSEVFAGLGFDQFLPVETPVAIHGLFGSYCDEIVAVRRT